MKKLLTISGVWLVFLTGLAQILPAPGTVRSVTNIAQLKQVIAAQVLSGGQSTIEVLGKLTSGDGGGGKFFRALGVATNTAAWTNGLDAVYVRANDGTIWERTIKDPVDPRWFGSIPYKTGDDTVSPYGGDVTTTTSIGTGDFSLWFRLKVPASFDFQQSLFMINGAGDQGGRLNTFEARGDTTSFGFVFRSDTGSSVTGTTLAEGSTLIADESILLNRAGEVIDLVVTREGTSALVYIDGVNVSTSFTLSNPAGWAKSLVMGSNVMAQVGIAGNQGWYWQEPIHRFAMWNRLLSPAEVTDDLGVASGKVIDWTGYNTNTPPVDSSTGINAAVRYAFAAGARTVLIGNGKYRLDEPVYLLPAIDIKGVGLPPHYSGLTGSGTYGSTTLVPWFRATNDVFVATKGNARPEVFLAPTTIGHVGQISTKYMHSTISGLTIDGSLSKNSRGIYADRVGSLIFKDLQVTRLPNKAIYVVGGNGVTIENVNGPVSGGFAIIGTTDARITGNFIDGFYGVGLLAIMNQTPIHNNVIDVTLNQLGGAQFSYGGAVVPDTVNNTFLKVDHRLKTGDIVWFESAETLPAPLVATTHYYVIRVSDDLIAVATDYINETAGTGALNGTRLDITTAGTGTINITTGPGVGVFVTGDDNTLIGNRFYRHWREGLRIQNGFGNIVIGNNILDTGMDNVAETNVTTGVRLINAPLNTFIGNVTGTRFGINPPDFSFVGDSSSTNNIFLANRDTLAVNYSISEQNYVMGLFGKNEFGNVSFSPTNLTLLSTNGFLLIPGSPGVITNLVRNAPGLLLGYDSTGDRLYGSDLNTKLYWPGIRAGSSNTFSYPGILGTLVVTGETNSPTAAAFFINLPYRNAIWSGTVGSPTAGQGFRYAHFRNATEVPGEYAAIPAAGYQIAEYLNGGYFGTDASDVSATAVSLEFASAGPFTPTSTPGQVAFYFSPTNGIVRQPGMIGTAWDWNWYVTELGTDVFEPAFEIRDPVAANQLSIRAQVNNSMEDIYYDPASGVVYIGTLSIGAGGLSVLKAGDVMTGPLTVSNTSPRIEWFDSNGGVDVRRWDFNADSGSFQGRHWNDAITIQKNWLIVIPATTNIGSIQLLTATNGLYIDSTATGEGLGLYSMRNGATSEFKKDTASGVIYQGTLGSIGTSIAGTNVTSITNGPMIVFEIAGGIATPVLFPGSVDWASIVNVTDGAFIGRGQGLGPGPATELIPEAGDDIGIEWDLPAVRFYVSSNNVPRLNAPTNAFTGLISAPEIQTPSLSVDAMAVGELTVTNYKAALTIITPSSGTTNFTIDFNAGGAQVIVATDNVHLLHFPNMPDSGFAKWVNLTVIPSGGNRTISVRDSAGVTNVRTGPLLESAYVITNAMELVIRGMVGTAITNIAVFPAVLVP